MRRQSSYTRAFGYLDLSRPRRFESTSATQTSVTSECDAIPSSVENAIDDAPNAASRRRRLGGAEIRLRMKNGAAAVRKNVRRLVIDSSIRPPSDLFAKIDSTALPDRS